MERRSWVAGIDPLKAATASWKGPGLASSYLQQYAPCRAARQAVLSGQQGTVAARIAHTASVTTCPSCQKPGQAVPTEAKPAILVLWGFSFLVRVTAFYSQRLLLVVRRAPHGGRLPDASPVGT